MILPAVALPTDNLLRQERASDKFGPSLPEHRLAVLDVARGLAILLIFFLNIPAMGNSAFYHFGNPALDGWTKPDQFTWAFLHAFVEGTQRGLLEFLFGAGALLQLKRSFDKQRSGATQRVYFRRYILLAGFGFIDVFAMGWFGDILLPYALAALCLFWFRNARVRTLLLLCFLYLGAQVALNVRSFGVGIHVPASVLIHGQNRSSFDESAAALLPQRSISTVMFQPPATVLLEERAARFSAALVYWKWLVALWFQAQFGSDIVYSATDILFSMLFGMALFRLGITQGHRTARFYTLLALFTYSSGLLPRALDSYSFIATQKHLILALTLDPVTRFLVSIGHLALINLLFSTPFGSQLLRPFQMAGRNAITLYLLQNFLGLWVLFPRVGLGLWGRYGWFDLTLIGTAVCGCELCLASLWGSYFLFGPLEWLWRSVAYLRLQPIRRSAQASMLRQVSE